MTRHPTMTILTLLAALVLAACTGSAEQDEPAAGSDARPAAAAAQVPSPQPALAAEGITVDGHGRVTDEPDTLRANVGVHVVRDSVDTAFDDAAAAAERVLAALRDAGVAEEDIATTQLTVRPEREPTPQGVPEIVGYAVRNIVEVTIRDVDAAGELLAAVADAGGDDARIEGLRFALEDNAEQLEAARQAAFEDARSKAEHYASLAGVELGDLLGVTEISADLPAPMRGQEMAAADAAAAAPIQPGQQEVGVRVQARWGLR